MGKVFFGYMAALQGQVAQLVRSYLKEDWEYRKLPEHLSSTCKALGWFV